MNNILKCYVSGRHLTGQEKSGIVSFAVPDYGLLFRCLAEGSRVELEVVALLSFLRFAEHNIEIFQKRELEIYTDFPVLAYIMNNDSVSGQELDAVRREAQKAARKLQFKVTFIDSPSNRAAGSAGDIPAMPIGSALKIKTFANLAVKKSKDNRSDGLNF